MYDKKMLSFMHMYFTWGSGKHPWGEVRNIIVPGILIFIQGNIDNIVCKMFAIYLDL